MVNTFKRIAKYFKDIRADMKANPCKYGSHDEFEVDHAIVTGMIRNNITGASYEIPTKASLHMCRKCNRVRGHTVSSNGHTKNYYDWQLDVLMQNTGMRVPWEKFSYVKA